MECKTIKEFKISIPERKAILGFDFGEKRLGVAVSDLSRMVATSYKIIYRADFDKDLADIKNIIAEKQIGGIVYGLPLQMNGLEGKTAQMVREFAAKIDENLNLPYAFWDERLSSSAVENFLIKEVDMSRKRRKEVLDSSAASYILQGFLDALTYA